MGNKGKKSRYANYKMVGESKSTWVKVSQELYQFMLDNQNNRCAICQRHRSTVKKDFAIDHCHKTMKIRGLLCHMCNQGLGFFRDSANILRIAGDYIDSD